MTVAATEIEQTTAIEAVARPLRVLHLNAGNMYGGVERVLAALARERAHCIAMSPSFGLCFEGRSAEELRDIGVDVHRLGSARFSRPWTVWAARRRVAELLRPENFDIVVCHGCWPHALFGPVVRAAGIPLVFWSHDAPKGMHWVERKAARTEPDLVLANSGFTLTEIPRLFPGVRAEVMYSPVPLPEAQEAGNGRVEVRGEFRTPLNAILIVIACRLEPWKGHQLLLKALGRLRTLPSWQCWIVGGPQREEEQAYFRELETLIEAEDLGTRVQCLGQRSDVPRLLAAADIHCQPNLAPEPFGIAFVEALHAGLPVVTTAMGAAVEVVSPSCGMLTLPGDVAALAEALARLIRDPDLRTRLGASGRLRARELCDPVVRIPALGRLLQSVAHLRALT